MTFKKQQDRAVLEAITTDAVDTVVVSFVLEEEALIQFNLFVKAEDDAGRSMNLIFNGSAKRLVGQDAVLVGAVQQNSNRRDPGVLWGVAVSTNSDLLEVHIVGEDGVTVQWAVSFFMDWVF